MRPSTKIYGDEDSPYDWWDLPDHDHFISEEETS